jgi:hypothetical protein
MPPGWPGRCRTSQDVQSSGTPQGRAALQVVAGAARGQLPRIRVTSASAQGRTLECSFGNVRVVRAQIELPGVRGPAHVLKTS